MFTFQVRPEGGEAFTVIADSRDVFVWEQSAHGRILADLQRPAMSDFLALAHAAAKRQGLFTGSRAEFAAGCVVEIVEDTEPDPTQPEA